MPPSMLFLERAGLLTVPDVITGRGVENGHSECLRKCCFLKVYILGWLLATDFSHQQIQGMPLPHSLAWPGLSSKCPAEPD